MNSVEKRSFYSFLILYISSSFLFVSVSGFWYYKAQQNALAKTTYYKLQHYADKIAGNIINAQMHGIELTLPTVEEGYSYELIRDDANRSFEKNYFTKEGVSILVSDAPQEHLHVKYVVVKTDAYTHELHKLQREVTVWIAVVFVLIALISFFLAKLFMRPIHQKMQQIENFILDISHELNTPITALKMSSKRAMQKGVYDEKILTNISISTKQLYTIYKSLAYLNFSNKPKERKEINLEESVQEVIEYYAELCNAKNITIESELEDTLFFMDEDRAKLLFSNLLSNAIKYSMPHKTIHIKLQEHTFIIEDEGIGIAEDKLEDIFQLYARGSSMAGGFGVGLSIVKQICDEYNIELHVTSKENVGSRFSLKF